MTHSPPDPNEGMITAELKGLLERILTAIDHAPADQKQRLLKSLQKWQKGERRKHSRKGCSIPVRIGAWRALTEYIRNISMGGVFIKTSDRFSIGEHLTLIFSLPNKSGPIKATGHVVWTSPEGIGVEFTSPLSKEVKAVIESL
jgi:hypothetical protein